MKRFYLGLVLSCLFYPFLSGQGCAPIAPETNEQRAYRLCAAANTSADSTLAFIHAIESDRLAGFSYNYEISEGMAGCDWGCDYETNCENLCYNCVIAIIDTAYLGKDAIAAKEAVTEEPGQSELFRLLTQSLAE
jgi:hypothetical protein